MHTINITLLLSHY